MNASEFLNALAAHSILSTGDLGTIRGALAADKLASDAEAVAKELVRSGLLTRYQAAHVYKGRAKALVFGEYIVLDKLGAGGMGQVFKAQHRRMKRVVALKVLPPQTTNSDRAVKRFYQEVEMAARLSHPNIVTAYDAGEAHGLHYLAMECVDGKDLSYIVTRSGPLGVDQAMFCVKQAACGLQYAHEQGIIHRDIKPSNLLVDRRSVLKILDLGLARLTDNLGRPDDSAGLTEAGQVMGTVDYMAPEQAHDTRSADHRADIYSLGCTLFWLLTDKVPYPADTILKKILAHREQPIPSLRSVRQDVPPRLDQLCQRMLAKDPAQRAASMTEVAATLEALLAGKSDEASSVAVLDEQPANDDWQSFLKSSKDDSGSSAGRNAPRDTVAGSVAERDATTAGEQAGRRKPRWAMVALCGAVVGVIILFAAARMLLPSAKDESVRPRPTPVKQAAAETSAPLQTAQIAAPAMPATTAPVMPTAAPAAPTSPSPLPASPAPAQLASAAPVSNPRQPAPETIAASSKKPAPLASPPASTAPTGPSPALAVEAVTGPIDLLKRMDGREATFGKWSLEPAGLVWLQTDAKVSKIAIPFAPPEDYDLTLTAEGPVTKSDIRMGLVVGGKRTIASLYPQQQGPQVALAIWLGANDAGLRDLVQRPIPLMEAGANRITVVYMVRHGRVCIKVDGNLALDWAGDPATLNAPTAYVDIGDARSLSLGIARAAGIRDLAGDVRITQLEIAQPTGILPASSRVDLLARYAVTDEGNSEAVVSHGDVTLQARSATAAAYANFATPRSSEYTLSMVVERTAGVADVMLGLPIGNHVGASALRGENTFFESSNTGLGKGGEILPGQLHTVSWVIGAKQTAILVDHRYVVDLAQASNIVQGTSAAKMGAKPGGQRVYFRVGEGCGYRIRGLEITPAGWRKLRRPQSEDLTAARKSLDNQALAANATVAQKIEAAGHLWRGAAESLDDEARRYVSLEAVAMLAANAGDLSLACHAATDLARTFEGDFHDLFERLVAEAFRVARSPDDKKAIVEVALSQIDLAVAWEQFDLALALQAAAQPAAAKLAASDLVKELKARGLELQLSAAESKRYQAAEQKLLAGKADAAAHADIAEYLATVRKDWPGAAREFEAAGVAPLRDLAQAEASHPDTPARQLELAELWWAWADKSEPLLKQLAVERAFAWTVRAEAGGAKSAKPAAAHHRQTLLQQRRTSNLAFLKRHPLDAVKVGNSWFKVYNVPLNWHEASTLCEEVGGSLPIIDSSAKNQAVAQTLMTLLGTAAASSCWLGLTDSGSEGNWRWVDGSPLGPGSFTGWTEVEPDNNGGNQNYAVLFVAITRGQQGIRWSDEIEGRTFPVLCEWRQ